MSSLKGGEPGVPQKEPLARILRKFLRTVVYVNDVAVIRFDERSSCAAQSACYVQAGQSRLDPSFLFHDLPLKWQLD